MNTSFIFIVACVPIFLLNIIGVTNNFNWMVETSEFLIYIPLIIAFAKRLDFKNKNVTSFLILSVIAALTNLFLDGSFGNYTSMLLIMGSYFFLTREALKHTRRKNANNYMVIFFVVLVATNTYFLYEHFQQIQMRIKGMMALGFYWAYYLNLFVLAIVGLIYYLNSYSKKSVYFITLLMTIIIADMLKDMAGYYFRDSSVMVIESILRFFSVILAFQFFATKEKKLRLINLL